jgi:hypothetical protein
MPPVRKPFRRAYDISLPSSAEGEAAAPLWLSKQMVAMDKRFRKAVLRAVERGEETCATVPSTRVGTMRPITNYQRPE